MRPFHIKERYYYFLIVSSECGYVNYYNKLEMTNKFLCRARSLNAPHFGLFGEQSLQDSPFSLLVLAVDDYFAVLTDSNRLVWQSLILIL